MKWVKLSLLVLLLLILALFPMTVRAATTAEVTITAAGYVCDAPGGFTISYISDYEVGISWTKGADANNTMIRATVGREPTSRTDGYLVYYGQGNSTTDWSNNLDTMDAKVHYRAWSESAAGAWSSEYAEGFIEGIGMKLIAFIVLALGLMIAGFIFKKQALMMASGLAWAGLGLYMRTQSGATAWADWDIYMLFFWLGVALALVCFFETWLVGRKAQAEIEKKEDVDEYLESYGAMQGQIAKLRNLRRKKRS